MAVAAPPNTDAARRVALLERMWAPQPGVLGWLTTTDHKRIGLLYFWTTLVFFAAGGAEALIMRTQLAQPNSHLVGPNTYDQLFTMHGMTMIFWFIIPMTTGAFGNYLLPLMIGARDMAFPKMNALSFWIFAASGIFLYCALAIGQAPNAGWFDYVPLASRQYDPGRNIDFYALGIIFNSIASTLTAGQFIVTIFKSRSPGMSLNRLPLFCYAMLAAAFGLLFALPALSVDTVFLFLDRNVGTHFFDVAHGGSALVWQNLFWFFGHPEVYILIVPAFGIATSIIPAFTQRKLVAFPLVAIAELLVVFIGFGVWAHHMFATGLPTVALIFFAGATAMVVIPSTIQVFAWCMSFLTGTPRFRTPLLFIAGFIFMFVTGGLTGMMFVSVPFDQQVTDTYFVIAHFHYIIFGAAVFPIFGGMYYWFPKVTGKLYFERPGQISFWVLFVGTNLLFFPMHIVGLLGMTRREYTYPSGLGWTAYNLAETVGGFITLAGILLLLGNLFVSYFRGAPSGADPWHGPTLEWTTTSPPPEYNYPVLPRVTSAYANWDDAASIRDQFADGELALMSGHQQVESEPVDGAIADTAEMPHSSPWPPVLALTVSLVFVALVMQKFGLAGIMGALCVFVLVAWHAEDRERPTSITAVWGMWILIATEATLFACLIATYYYLRFHTPAWPPHGDASPPIARDLILAFVLLATSVPIQLAVRATRAAAARFFIVVALFVQCGYLAFEIDDYAGTLRHMAISRDAYTSLYYTLLGADHAHVALGLLFSAWLLWNLHLNTLRAIAWYWHFVNALTLIVISCLLSATV
ncbi:MAG TPA: cbb3-type cytochrome c oxidase subunit I [Gaiellaceae bacterium]|nr:cbb3-type cytochrome c oxidase subunit I [Gaiellaceae bacterium]